MNRDLSVLRLQRLRRLAGLLATRTLGGAAVLFASATVTFFALHLVPGDPVTAILGGPATNPTPATVAAVRKEYGFDRPLAVQYVIYIRRLLHGNLGNSYSQHVRVSTVLSQQAGQTLLLTVSALATAWTLALVSVILTVRRSGFLDSFGSTIEGAAAALPPFWLGILMLSAFAFELRIFPPAGNNGFASLILPSLAMAIPLGGFIAHVTRESLELAFDQPFILSARARGLSERGVMLKHALRHALLPGISLSGWAVGALIGGAVVIEVIFARKGLGRQLFLAVSTRDMPLTIGITLLVTVGYIVANILVDVLYVVIDPRLKTTR